MLSNCLDFKKIDTYEKTRERVNAEREFEEQYNRVIDKYGKDLDIDYLCHCLFTVAWASGYKRGVLAANAPLEVIE